MPEYVARVLPGTRVRRVATRKKAGGKPHPKAKTKTKAKAKRERSAVEKIARAAGWMAGAMEGLEVMLTPTRDLFDSIHARRSHKRFKDKPVDADHVRVLLDAAVTAPNHKMTEPWGFLVLGPNLRRTYAERKAQLKFGELIATDGNAKADQMITDLLGVPVVIGVTQKVDADPVRREEDYAAVFMAIQNMLLAGTALGLGTKVQTGNILDDEPFRAALGLTEGERLVAVLHVGEPSEEMPAKKRTPSADKTRWLD
ncbi:MAG: nitroreductase family protein [Longimicrobiales bacterium]